MEVIPQDRKQNERTMNHLCCSSAAAKHSWPEKKDLRTVSTTSRGGLWSVVMITHPLVKKLAQNAQLKFIPLVPLAARFQVKGTSKRRMGFRNWEEDSCWVDPATNKGKKSSYGVEAAHWIMFEWQNEPDVVSVSCPIIRRHSQKQGNIVGCDIDVHEKCLSRTFE